MESVGAKLKKIRQEKGLSLEEVQKKTKIHPNILKAIEEDNFINLSPVYVKGFLKIYCKFLGVDPAGYILEYTELENSAPEQPGNEAKNSVYPRSAPVKVAAGGSPRVRDMIIKTAMLVVIVFLLASAGLFMYRKITAFVIMKSGNRSAVDNRPHAAKKLPKTVLSQQKNKAQTTQKLKPGTPIRLGIRAKEDCWIKLSLDGKVVFQNILKKGRSENWQAKKEIEASLGNAGGVELEVNGNLISSVGRKGQSIKNMVINEDGLRVN